MGLPRGLGPVLRAVPPGGGGGRQLLRPHPGVARPPPAASPAGGLRPLRGPAPGLRRGGAAASSLLRVAADRATAGPGARRGRLHGHARGPAHQLQQHLQRPHPPGGGRGLAEPLLHRAEPADEPGDRGEAGWKRPALLLRGEPHGQAAGRCWAAKDFPLFIASGGKWHQETTPKQSKRKSQEEWKKDGSAPSGCDPGGRTNDGTAGGTACGQLSAWREKP
mmetsp:Transcript_10543/g.17033  ORF Transcript_10543/g.17033 Transcript_10543/m.17033 type:complete len:221 (+) Transcript_10543:346-1008(+)